MRPIGPADRELLLEGFDQLSDEARYMRFFTVKPALTSGELRFLTEPDGVSHVALGAALREPDGTLRGLGVARFVRAHDEPAAASVAITVAEEARRHGLAAKLLSSLARVALLRSIERFRFMVLPENVAMRSFLAAHRVPMVVRDGVLHGQCETVRAARIASSKRWRRLLERSG